MGSKRAPTGARPIPRWVGVLMGLSFAFGGADLFAYKFIASSFPHMTPFRQACLAAICVCLAWGLGELYAGLNARTDLFSIDQKNYRSSAFLGAFVSPLFALTAAYFAFVAH